MVKIVLAPDKFRGSLTATEVCAAMSEGIRQVIPNAEIIALPMADGGEGTAEILTLITGGQMLSQEVADPLGRPIQASYGLSSQTAYIEMATASGLKLLSEKERNPLKTSTYGTGQLIQSAVKKGAKRLVLGIGGSATTDAGIGMAAALGWKFLDANNQEVAPTGENLIRIEQIIPPSQPIADLHIEVACDVNAPLFGPEGAAYLYAPQKGATPITVKQLDEGLQHLSAVVQRDFGKNLAQTAGAGAAGGLGFGALFFLNATLKEGIKIVMEQTEFHKHLLGANLVLTGEGKIDEQTLQGKLIAGIAQAAQAQNIPSVALCGTLLVSPQDIQRIGLSYAVSILPRPMTLNEAIVYAYTGVRDSTVSLMQFLKSLQYLSE
jgi:glycerate kinase